MNSYAIIFKVRSLGRISMLFWNVLKDCVTLRIRWNLLAEEMYKTGTKSLSLVNITALFIGMVFAVQIAYSLDFLGAKYFLGQIIGIAIVRELGPVVTALLVAGRAGSGMAAEIGSMRVTEQVDALVTFGISPVNYLAVPRVLALVIMQPVLTMFADFIGIAGGMIISAYQLNIGGHFYLRKVITFVTVDDVLSGLGKSVFFGLFIALIACYHGLKVKRGADEVGRAATKTVVSASITVLISDFFLTKLFMLF